MVGVLHSSAACFLSMLCLHYNLYIIMRLRKAVVLNLVLVFLVNSRQRASPALHLTVPFFQCLQSLGLTEPWILLFMQRPYPSIYVKSFLG